MCVVCLCSFVVGSIPSEPDNHSHLPVKSPVYHRPLKQSPTGRAMQSSSVWIQQYRWHVFCFCFVFLRPGFCRRNGTECCFSSLYLLLLFGLMLLFLIVIVVVVVVVVVVVCRISYDWMNQDGFCFQLHIIDFYKLSKPFLLLLLLVVEKALEQTEVHDELTVKYNYVWRCTFGGYYVPSIYSHARRELPYDSGLCCCLCLTSRPRPPVCWCRNLSSSDVSSTKPVFDN